MTDKCEELVFSPTPGDFRQRQCSKPAGYGRDGKFCPEHAKHSMGGPVYVEQNQKLLRRPGGGNRRD